VLGVEGREYVDRRVLIRASVQDALAHEIDDLAGARAPSASSVITSETRNARLWSLTCTVTSPAPDAGPSPGDAPLDLVERPRDGARVDPLRST
jgi:hypothetical protein